MINRFVGIGRLTRDPELRYTSSGVAVVSFKLAIDRKFKNQDGNRESDFINCVAWRQQAELIANYLKKGSQAGVEGSLQTRSYQNQEGKTVFVTEVVIDNVQFLSPAKSSQNESQKPDDPFQEDGEVLDISDDDLPFDLTDESDPLEVSFDINNVSNNRISGRRG